MYMPSNCQQVQLTPYYHSFFIFMCAKTLQLFPLALSAQVGFIYDLQRNMQNVIKVCHLGKVTK
jgi:hypothetical protein